MNRGSAGIQREPSWMLLERDTLSHDAGEGKRGKTRADGTAEIELFRAPA